MIETIPNVSEGRRAEVVTALAEAVRQTPDVALLDFSADPSHNRSVFTIVGRTGAAVEAALVNLFRIAVDRIDLRAHTGRHPRVGAVDVVPLVPLGGSSMTECIDVSRHLGRTLAETFHVPVFLYEASATTPARRRLEHIRQGQFEGLSGKMQLPDWRPDFGPLQPHPTAGATVVGARLPLIAFNIDLDSRDVAIARQIAAAIRESSGGLPCVKALGLWLDHRNLAQVSMNVTDFTTTSLQTVVDAVEREAAARGVRILESELIGLIPAAALEGTTSERLKLARFTRAQVLEERIAQTLGAS